MKNNISLSIIIPFFNRISLLIKTLESIKTNKDLDYEIILIDDGSSEVNYQILDSYLNQNTHYYKINNSERGFARNYGALKSNGQYLNFFDSDDICFPNHIASFKNFIIKNKFPKIFTNSYSFIDLNKKIENKIIFNGIINDKIFKHNILSCNSVFIEKKFFLENKFSDNRDLSGSEDWDLWLRLANKEIILGNRIISTALNNHLNRSTKKQSILRTIKRLEVLNERVIDKRIINLDDKKLKTVLSEIYSFK